MYSHDKLFLHSLECYFGVNFPSWEATREINTKITLSWVLKQFITRVHTLFSMYATYSISHRNCRFCLCGICYQPLVFYLCFLQRKNFLVSTHKNIVNIRAAADLSIPRYWTHLTRIFRERIQYRLRHFILRSRQVGKAWDWVLKGIYHFEIWQGPTQ